MANILTYVRTLFNWLFVTTTGENAHTAAITQVVNFHL